MNCDNKKNSSKNIIFIGIIIVLIGGYLYTQHPAWLVGAAPLLLFLCCPIMMLMMRCMNKNDEKESADGCNNKTKNITTEKTIKD